MYFRNYVLGKRGLDKYLKSDVSQCPSTSNMVKVLKHILKDKGRTFMILID